MADVHFGKSALYRKQVSSLPGGSSAHDLQRLRNLISRCGAQAIVFLGDTLHAPSVRNTSLMDYLRDWITSQNCSLRAIPGNHDDRAMDVLCGLGFSIGNDGELWNGVALCHTPPENPAPAALCGHLHPGVIWRGRGGQHLRLPCFWVRGRVCCLPAFGSFTGLSILTSRKGDAYFVVAGNSIVRLPMGRGAK